MPVDRPPAITVAGLDGGQSVELRAAWRSDTGERWTSSHALQADGDGRAKAGAEVLTAMRPPGPHEAPFVPVLGRNEIELTVHEGDDVLARGTLVRELPQPSLGLRIRSFGLAGMYFEPRDPARGAAVLVLGGGEGGFGGLANEAAALAAAGHPVLAMAYFGAPGLPQSLDRLPVERVAQGVAWLRRRPAAKGRPVALMGVSTGGELALLAASLDPTLASTVVALVPSSRVQFGDERRSRWTWRNREVPVRSRIPVQRIRGRILAVGGGQDVVWYSRSYVNEIAERGRRVDPRVYDDAGHGIGLPLPYLPAGPTNLTGGTPEADEAARRDLWPRILRALN